MSETPNESPDARESILVVDGDVARGERLQDALVAESRDVHLACDLRSALELVAQQQPDLVMIETAQLASGGTILLERVAALAPWAALIATVGPSDPAARRALVRRFELHGIHDGDTATLGDLAESALASALRARRRLSESELREVIVAKLCHEMRTCLYVIEGYSEILCDTRDAQGREEVAARIGSTSHLALRLVQDYLDLARLEPRAGEAHAAPVDLGQLIEELRADVQRRTGPRPLRLDVDGAAPGDVLDVDGDQLRSVLSHLVANVVERSGHGAVRLEIRVGPAATDFVVASDGDAGRESWSTPRAESVARDDVSLSGIRGHGLALAIAFRLSRMLGGTLDSDLGAPRSARFRLRIPIRVVAQSERDAQEPASSMPILH